jgi:hypothetical protein
MDHDRLFKELLTNFFAEFVELLLPDVAQYMERDSLEFLDSSARQAARQAGMPADADDIEARSGAGHAYLRFYGFVSEANSR